MHRYRWLRASPVLLNRGWGADAGAGATADTGAYWDNDWSATSTNTARGAPTQRRSAAAQVEEPAATDDGGLGALELTEDVAAEQAPPMTPRTERPPPPFPRVTVGPGESIVDAVAKHPFRMQMVELKRAARGAAQRPQNLRDARAVLERSIPADTAAMGEWLTQENATTALNAATFYEIEIPHQSLIEEWAVKSLSTFEPFNMATTGISLLQLKKNDATFADKMRKELVPVLREKLPDLRGDAFHTAVRVLQRVHTDDPGLWDDVCTQVKAREQQISRKPQVAVRLFSCIARHNPEHDVTRELFEFLLAQIENLKSFDFSTFLSACERWGKLSATDALPLLRRQADRIYYCNARDLGITFPSSVRIYRALAEKKLSTSDDLKLAQHLRFVFDACETHLERCMNPSLPDFYWEHPTDIISAVFAYESCDVLPTRLFDTFIRYIVAKADTLSARDTAMVLGILRRAERLTPEICQVVAPILDKAIADSALTLEEASHAALSLATASHASASLKALETYATKHWSGAASPTASVIFGQNPNAKHFTAANLSAVFDNKVFASYDATALSVRQLLDVRTHGTQKKSQAQASDELLRRLNAFDDPMAARDLVLIARRATEHSDPLRRPVQTRISRSLDEMEWGPSHLDLLLASNKLDKSTFAARAIALGRELAVSPQQLLSVSKALLKLYPDENGVRDLVKLGSQSLVQTSVTYSIELAELLSTTPLAVGKDWFQALVTGPVSRSAKRESLAEIAKAVRLADRAGAFSDADVKRKPSESVPHLVAAAAFQVTEGTADATDIREFAEAIKAVNASALETDAFKEAVAKAKPRATHEVPKPKPKSTQAPTAEASASKPKKAAAKSEKVPAPAKSSAASKTAAKPAAKAAAAKSKPAAATAAKKTPAKSKAAAAAPKMGSAAKKKKK